MPWVQIYDPLANVWLSTLVAAFPIVLLLVALAVLEWKAQWAALAGLSAALLVSVAVYGMPVSAAAATAVYGAAYGLFPIGWIILNAVFLYNLTVETGQFEVVKGSVARLSADRRIQALLVAFSFGAFIEGAAGFGTPVAITAALLMGLGFTPLYAAGLSLIANTAPVAYGAIGTPILTLAAVTGIPSDLLSAMAGRQLPIVSVIVPAWLVVTMSGWRGLKGAWPAVLVSGGSFAIVQFLWSNFVGPELVDIIGGLVSLGCLAVFCTWWRPAEMWDFPAADGARELGAGDRSLLPIAASAVVARPAVIRAWMPWVFLSIFVTAWGAGPFKAFLNGGPAGAATYRETGRPPAPHPILSPAFDVPALHRRIFREHPVEVDAVDRARLGDPAYRRDAARRRDSRSTGCRPRHGDPVRGAHHGALPADSASTGPADCGDDPDADAGAAAHDRLHAVARVRHPVWRHRRHARPGLHADGRAVPVLCRHARVARRGAHGFGHELERPVRQSAEDHRRSSSGSTDSDHDGELHGRRDGQDDRRAEHRRCHRRDEPAGSGGTYSALRVLAQRCACRDHGDHRDAAGIRVPLDGSLAMTTRRCDARFVSELRRIVGEEKVFTDPMELLTYECDALTHLRAVPGAVVVPSSASEVQAIVRLCARENVPFVPRGHGTGLSGGALPVEGGVVIALSRLNRVIDVDIPNRRVTVEPGVTNLEITRQVAPFGYYYAPDPSSQQVCSIGGNVAENSGGAHCLKYGFTVHHVLALDAVLPNGELVQLGDRLPTRRGPTCSACSWGLRVRLPS